MAQQSQGLPLGMDEIERLVKSLYDPGHAKKIPETEATLRILQRSPQGWEMGDTLLNSQDENVRFFGALTFTIKINSDSAGLSEEDSQQLLSKLIHHLVTRPASSVATRKLCSTLAQYFCKPISSWRQCIKSLCISFAKQQPILDDALEGQPAIWDVLPQLSDAQILVVLEFAMNLADEAKKAANTPDRGPHERMIDNVETVEVLLQAAFGRGIKFLSTSLEDPQYEQYLPLGEKICGAALKCFTGWIFYAQSEFKAIPEKLQHLRSVSELALTCLEYHVDDAMDLVAEVLENYPKFFETTHREMLWSAITSNWGMEILKNLDAETVALARIIVAYAQILLEEKTLYTQPDVPHHQQVMSALHELLKYPEPVGIEDEVAPILLDFWSNYVMLLAEETFQWGEDEKPDWHGKAASHIFLVMSEFLTKVTYPHAEVFRAWDSDSKRTFKVFRVDVRDIIMEAYEVLRDSMLDQFVDFCIRSLEAGDWLGLEAGMFCLISVSDALQEGSDEYLQRLFEQPLFSTMSADTDIPAVTRRTSVEAVAAFDRFFLRHPHFLPQVLPFLLSALAQPSLAHGAAKSFALLCSECRKSLTGELASFFAMYQQFLGYQTAEEYTKSRVLEGIAAIVQAQDTDEERLAGLQQMFQYISHDAMQAVNVTKENGDAEMGQVLALTTLKCLHGIGRSLQASDEEIIDLETSSSTEESTYWTAGPGKEIQNQIINFVNYLTSVFPANDEIIESACNVLRAGYRESVLGPFVLPASATIDWIVKTNFQTPRLPHVLDTACCWISAYKSDKTGAFPMQAQRLLHHVVALLQALQHPRNEPEVSVGCIELLQKFITTCPSILTTESPDTLQHLFAFSIECLKSPEVLPKRAAAVLWKDIFEASSNAKSEGQATCQEIVRHFGESVAFTLLWNVCGEVDGSSFDQIVIPLRKFVQSDRGARGVVEKALAQMPIILRVKEVPNQAAEVDGWVRRFVEGMVRNARTSNDFKETVKEFWQRCKQIQMQFAPQMMHPGHRFAHGIAPGAPF